MSISARGALAPLGLNSMEQLRLELGIPRPVGTRALLAATVPPPVLQFRLRYFHEHEGTEAGDEVFIGGVGLDSAAVVVGPDRQPAVDLVHAERVGDVSDDAVRDRWRDEPHVLIEFDPRRPGDWPRTYTVTLLVVEHDSADLGEAFGKLNDEVGTGLRVAAVAAASAASGALTGAVIGSVIPGIGTVVGAAVGTLAGLAYDGIISEIEAVFDNEAFTPVPVTLTVENPWRIATHPELGTERVLRIREHGTDYELFYDWHAV